MYSMKTKSYVHKGLLKILEKKTKVLFRPPPPIFIFQIFYIFIVGLLVEQKGFERGG